MQFSVPFISDEAANNVGKFIREQVASRIQKFALRDTWPELWGNTPEAVILSYSLEDMIATRDWYLLHNDGTNWRGNIKMRKAK